MSVLEDHVLKFALICLPIFLAAITLYIIRALKAPSVPDMVIAIDALGYDLAFFLLFLSIILKSPLLVPCALVLALWIYALDIYMAKYLEAKELGE